MSKTSKPRAKATTTQSPKVADVAQSKPTAKSGAVEIINGFYDLEEKTSRSVGDKYETTIERAEQLRKLGFAK